MSTLSRSTVYLMSIALAVPMALSQSRPLKIFISVDMEGIGGVGTAEMTRSGGKDYELGRQLMTDEVNTVVEAIRKHGEAEILVNDSHGDMQNLQHTRLDPRVEYIQGNIKALGMVQGLDESFDAAIFLGYHARAGTEKGFLAHTGSGSVKGLWLNDIEVGEGGLNAALAGELGVPVILAAGGAVFAEQIRERIGTRVVATKEPIGARSCRLYHPSRVQSHLREAVAQALRDLGKARLFTVGKPVRIRMRFATTTRPEVLQAIPGMSRVDGFTVAYTARDMQEAYRLIRVMYKYIRF
ncbi:MAG: M55 family metallopeptidase [Acidobacteriota bacterium]